MEQIKIQENAKESIKNECAEIKTAIIYPFAIENSLSFVGGGGCKCHCNCNCQCEKGM